MTHLKVLIVATSNELLGASNKPTGLWLEELASPYYAFTDAGFEVTVASIRGGQVPVDPRSENTVGNNPESVDRFFLDGQAVAKITNTPALADVQVEDYAAVFLSGGHGTMWDFPDNEALARLVSRFLQSNRIVAAVCHGSAGLLGAKNEDGSPMVKGRTLSAFTDNEERASEMADTVPFLLESRLRELGALVEKGDDFQPFAVVDGNLITGQNPASSAKVADLAVNQLQELAA